MIPTPWSQRRLLVPRWRSLALTLRSNELATPFGAREKTVTRKLSPDLLSKLVKWRRNPGIITAGELVGASLVEAQESEAVSAARYLLLPHSTATASLQDLATATLQRAGVDESTGHAHRRKHAEEKHLWRMRTRDYPQNALAWVELALHETIDGRKDAARHAMQVALKLAPHNRHVLRSASRLFLHLDKKDEAYFLVARNPTTVNDPWLIAAELSLAKVLERGPRYFRQGRDMVRSGNFLPRQITELAGAIATNELIAGNMKFARTFFETSVADPTGSSLAQAEWASPLLGADLVSAQRLVFAQEADEARTFHFLREQKLTEVPNSCLEWAKAEPYSIRPLEIGASIANVIGDYERAREFASDGLAMRDKAPSLLNNAAFALAHLGNLTEAQRILNTVPASEDHFAPLTEANRGLVAFRIGEFVEGVAHYKAAISGFQKLGLVYGANVATMFFAREAALAGLPEAKKQVKQARGLLKKPDLKVHERVIVEAETALKNSQAAKSNMPPTEGPPAKLTWLAPWDPRQANV